MTTALHSLLADFREKTLTVRDQGTSFEKLIVQYFKTEPFYQQQYTEVFMYGDWVEKYGEALGITSK